ncbi:MAG: cystathionine gamma-synthase [Acidimicrobiia bacterium]|nr:cystathionine gamma-synthase [Acidimicrobiia bacterium]
MSDRLPEHRPAATQGFETQGFETRAIHAGQEADAATGAVNVPVYLSSTFAQDGVGATRGGYEYGRTGNPTRSALEQVLASLEGARHGRAFASGLAAEDAILRLLAPGEGVLMGNDAYGGTFRLIDRVFGRAGIGWTVGDLTDPVGLDRNWPEGTRMVWVETPTNPALTVIDIAAVAEAAHRHDARLVVDNTFATPYLQQPLALGADIVVHSTTKYLGGHSDVVGGFVATNDADTAGELAFLQNAVGAVPGPFDCYLTLRGVKTLAVRMDRHCANAAAVARLLVNHPAVGRVMYPGLPGHPGHGVAKGQMRDFGGMVSFLARGGRKAARRIVGRTKVFTLAESLGAVESLIEYPAAMTHASVSGSPLQVDESLVRLSVGLETLDDLLGDLRRALDPETPG